MLPCAFPFSRRRTIAFRSMLVVCVACMIHWVTATESIASHDDTSADSFNGVWVTSYGHMRLQADGDQIQGIYDSPLGICTMSGEFNEGRFQFEYVEPQATGVGWFELDEETNQFFGKWQETGAGDRWFDWRGRRLEEPDGILWLVMLEANWEESLAEPEYAFGEMLESYFKMSEARHVQFRHRYFHDAADLQRFLADVQFLPGPAYVVISTHGINEGIVVGNRVIPAELVAQSLKMPSNVRLLHLSGCNMMASDYPKKIYESLGDNSTFPISGYKSTVNWHASALGDMIYLSLALIRRYDPSDAAAKAIKSSPFLGDEVEDGTEFAPLGLTVMLPPSDEEMNDSERD